MPDDRRRGPDEPPPEGGEEPAGPRPRRLAKKTPHDPAFTRATARIDMQAALPHAGAARPAPPALGPPAAPQPPREPSRAPAREDESYAPPPGGLGPPPGVEPLHISYPPGWSSTYSLTEQISALRDVLVHLIGYLNRIGEASNALPAWVEAKLSHKENGTRQSMLLHFEMLSRELATQGERLEEAQRTRAHDLHQALDEQGSKLRRAQAEQFGETRAFIERYVNELSQLGSRVGSVEQKFDGLEARIVMGVAEQIVDNHFQDKVAESLRKGLDRATQKALEHASQLERERLEREAAIVAEKAAREAALEGERIAREEADKKEREAREGGIAKVHEALKNLAPADKAKLAGAAGGAAIGLGGLATAIVEWGPGLARLVRMLLQ